MSDDCLNCLYRASFDKKCENCLEGKLKIIQQKDQRIAELETNLRETLDTIKNSDYKEVLEENISLSHELEEFLELTKKNRVKRIDLENQLTIKDKALELACEQIFFFCPSSEFDDIDIKNYKKSLLEQASKELKGGNDE